MGPCWKKPMDTGSSRSNPNPNIRRIERPPTGAGGVLRREPDGVRGGPVLEEAQTAEDQVERTHLSAVGNRIWSCESREYTTFRRPLTLLLPDSCGEGGGQVGTHVTQALVQSVRRLGNRKIHETRQRGSALLLYGSESVWSETASTFSRSSWGAKG